MRPFRRFTTMLPMQRLLLGLLVCAWLATQTFGLVHRELHGGALGGPMLAQQVQAAAAAADGAAAEKAGGLFAGHAQSSDCRLYDHAGLADLLVCVPTLAVPAVFVPFLQASPHAVVRDAGPVPFQARGPPSLR